MSGEQNYQKITGGIHTNIKLLGRLYTITDRVMEDRIFFRIVLFIN
jgi:hypothetical protein